MVASWNRKIQLRMTFKRLIASERLAGIGQVAQGVGHEFGNILLRIMGKADLAAMEQDTDKIKQHLEAIIQAAERAGVIVRNLQSFSKTERKLEQVRVDRPIKEALSLVDHELTKASILVETNLTETPPVQIDTGALGQVF